MARANELARILKVLSLSTRVRIIQLLKARVLCVNALAARLDVTQGAVSQHLRILRDAGLVTDGRRGYFVHYRLNEKTLAKWQAAIDDLLVPSSAKVTKRKKGVRLCPPTKKCNARSPRNSKASRKTAHPSRSRSATTRRTNTRA